MTALGVLDHTGNGLAISHDVGIFSLSTQDLLVSTTVPSGTAGTLVSGFRFESLGSPVELAAGSYVIVMTMPEGNLDYQTIFASSETTSSPVTYVNSRFDDGSTLAFPTIEGAFAPGMFGPNFEFASASVPEPSTLFMATAPMAVALVLTVRRRFKAA